MKPKKSLDTRPNLKSYEKESFRNQYQVLRPSYDRLSARLLDAIEELLGSAGIPYLDMVSRVKDIESALGKIERKQYAKPFEEIEDWCGLRIICYYPTDVERICAVLQDEFDIQQEEDTALRLRPHEFGYRSTHVILKIKSSWLNTPGYRGLGALKAEVQVRTILMHAWAEIEHKLAYKSSAQVPDLFKRKLYRLSAKFEEADEQFEEIRVGLSQYREEILDKVADDATAFAGQELNLDTLRAFLDTAFPEREQPPEPAAEFLEEITKVGLNMADLVDAYERTKSILIELERLRFPEELKAGEFPVWFQVGAMRSALDTTNDRYFKFRFETQGKVQEWQDEVSDARKRLAEIEAGDAT